MEYKTPQGREYGMVYLGKGERRGGVGALRAHGWGALRGGWVGCGDGWDGVVGGGFLSPNFRQGVMPSGRPSCPWSCGGFPALVVPLRARLGRGAGRIPRDFHLLRILS